MKMEDVNKYINRILGKKVSKDEKKEFVRKPVHETLESDKYERMEHSHKHKKGKKYKKHEHEDEDDD